MKTLAVLAHYDDEAISCPQYLLDHPGTTIFTVCGNDPQRHEYFDRVVDDVLAHELRANFKAFEVTSANIPAIADIIRSTVVYCGIERVITHHPLDLHQDHKITNQAVQIALRRLPDVELFYVKNPEGFPFADVHWDTIIKRTDEANGLVRYYKGINYPPVSEYEYYQTVRRFSI